MENSVICYLLDCEDDWGLWSEQLRETLAIQTLQEWLCSPNYKSKATYDEISNETTAGKHFLKFRSEDQYWKDSDYVKARDIVENIYQYWKEHKWVYEQTTRNGRPRRAEYSQETISKALRYAEIPFQAQDSEENVLYKSVAWSSSILGQASTQSWVKLVLMQENVFKQIYRKTGVEYFTGKTREEITEMLHLPKPFVNEFCRWLQDSGQWEILRRKVKGVVRRELCYTVLG
jgi:hypothetical protein